WGKWAMQFVTGRMTESVVPIRGGTLNIAGRTINDAWRKSFRASNMTGAALMGATLIYGVPNLIDAIKNNDGSHGILETRAGRTGVFGSIGAVVMAAVMGVACARSPGTGFARIGKMLEQPLMANGKVVFTDVAVTTPAI